MRKVYMILLIALLCVLACPAFCFADELPDADQEAVKEAPATENIAAPSEEDPANVSEETIPESSTANTPEEGADPVSKPEPEAIDPAIKLEDESSHEEVSFQNHYQEALKRIVEGDYADLEDLKIPEAEEGNLADFLTSNLPDGADIVVYCYGGIVVGVGYNEENTPITEEDPSESSEEPSTPSEESSDEVTGSSDFDSNEMTAETVIENNNVAVQPVFKARDEVPTVPIQGTSEENGSDILVIMTVLAAIIKKLLFI